MAGPSRLCGRSLLSPPGRKCRLYLGIRPSARPWRLWGTPAVPLEPDTAGGFRLALLVRNRISRFLSGHLAPRAVDLRKHLARRGVEAAGLCRPSPPPPLPRHRPARRACLPRSPAAPALGCSRGTLLRPPSVVHSSEPDHTSSPPGLWVQTYLGLNLSDERGTLGADLSSLNLGLPVSKVRRIIALTSWPRGAWRMRSRL